MFTYFPKHEFKGFNILAPLGTSHLCLTDTEGERSLEPAPPLIFFCFSFLFATFSFLLFLPRVHIPPTGSHPACGFKSRMLYLMERS